MFRQVACGQHLHQSSVVVLMLMVRALCLLNYGAWQRRRKGSIRLSLVAWCGHSDLRIHAIINYICMQVIPRNP